MKRCLYVALLGILACACTEKIIMNDPYSSGVCVGVVEVGAPAGSISVSVETKGNWRIESDCSWLATDTKGRTGNGAFTVFYSSNESDVLALRTTRTGRIAIRLEESMKVDTLVFVQRGLISVGTSHEVSEDPSLVLEYEQPQTEEIILLCCSSEGNGDISSWIESQDADIVVLDGEVTGRIDGLNVVGCNHAGMTVEQEYEAFRTMIRQTYNSGPYAGDDWIYAGQMYHLSVMQTGYASTPDWYPSATDAPEFMADLYAWQNNLYDCVWMYVRDYVSTYVDGEGRSFCADYAYVSASVLAKLTSVGLLDVEGLSHKAIRLTLNY